MQVILTSFYFILKNLPNWRNGARQISILNKNTPNTRLTKLSATVVLITLIFATQACSQKLQHNLKPFKQLLGSWETETAKGKIIESWEYINVYTLSGKTIRVGLQNDTTVLEQVLVIKRGRDIYYIPTASDQNQGKPVEFKFISNANGIYVFENKLHDFPQRVCYELRSDNELWAWIEGVKDGKFRKSEFKYQRILLKPYDH